MSKLKTFFLIITFNLIFITKLFAYEIPYENHKHKHLFTKQELEYIKSNPQINIAMMSNFKPFSFIENNKHQGFAVDLVHLISDISGLKFKISTNLWRENLKAFKNKKYDLITGISHTKKREEFTLFTEAYYEIPTYIFGLKGSPKISSIYELKGKRLGVSHSLYYKEDLLKNGIKVVELKNSNEKAKALILNEIDYFLASYTSGKKAITTQAFTSITAIDEFKGVKKEDLRFGVKKDNPILQSILDKSMQYISKNNYNNLINKWIFELKEIKNKRITLTNEEEKYLIEKKYINLCVDPDWMPFESINKKGEHIGLSSEYINLFKEMLNVPIKLNYTNTWIETLKNIKNKKCDIVSLAIKTKSRESFMNFTKPYISTPIVLATKFNKPFIANIEQLEDEKVGIVGGYAFFELLKNKYPNLNIVPVNSIDEGLEKTVDGEIFGMIDALPTIVYKLQNNYLGELKIGGKFDDKFSLGVGVRKDSEHLLNIFNKLIDNIPQTEKQEILNKHITVKYEDSIDYEIIWKISIFAFVIFSFLIYRQYIQNKNNEKLKESFNKIQTILDTTMEAIIISENRKIIDVNKEFLKLFKYNDKNEVLQRELSEFVEESNKVILFENLKKDYPKPYEINCIKANNQIFPALVRGKNIKEKDANFRVSTLLDLTDIKKKEALLIQQSKIATAGEMLENISHQWRQPLSQISTIATGIKIQKECDILNDANLTNDMDKINNSVQYLSQTIEDFNSFLKPNSEINEIFEIKNTIEKLNKLIKDTYEYHNIEIIADINNCTIFQNENLLLQALLNIANNAKDAITQNNNKKEKSYIFISTECKDKFLKIKIKDSGKGIDSDIINKIFEPYFTTKHESVGTGIGLYMTYQIITKQMKGSLSVKNSTYEYNKNKYEGAEFTIKIPYELT